MSQSDLVLEVKDLKKRYKIRNSSIFGKERTKSALDGVSFYIRKGEVFGIVGESGCGKSTLGRSIVGLTGDVQGEILLHGEDIRSVKDVSSKVQIVFQDPLSSLNPKKKIGWILEEPLRVHKIGDKEERKKTVNKMLELIGLDISYRNRFPHELSGGQRQRISIGSALMLNPELIIADEPVSALDVSVQAQILNLMQDLQKKLNLSYLFISHNLNVVYYMCDRVAVMYLGKIVELASVGEIYDNPKHPYTMALLGAIPQMDDEKKSTNYNIQGELTEVEDSDDGCSFYKRCPDAKDICRNKKCELVKINDEDVDEHLVRCHFAVKAYHHKVIYENL